MYLLVFLIKVMMMTIIRYITEIGTKKESKHFSPYCFKDFPTDCKHTNTWTFNIQHKDLKTNIVTEMSSRCRAVLS